MTTATCTAVSSPAADARTRQPRRRRPPPRGARSASARSPASSRSAVAATRRQRTSDAPHGLRRPAAARPARRPSRSRPSPASSRGRPAPRPARPPRSCRRVAQTNSSERGAHGRLGRVGERRRPSRRPSACGGDPDVDRLLARVGRDDRVGRPQQRLAQPLRDQRLADAGQAQRPDLASRRPTPRAASRGSTSSAHIGRISRGGPGQRDDHAAVGPVDPPAGRGAVGVRRASIADGSTHACLRLVSGNGWRRRAHRPAQPLERRLDPRPAVSPQASATASRVRSSGVGPRPPVVTTRSARASAVRSASTTDGEVVGEVRDPDDRHAQAPRASGPARRCWCRSSRRPSARCRSRAAPP